MQLAAGRIEHLQHPPLFGPYLDAVLRADELPRLGVVHRRRERCELCDGVELLGVHHYSLGVRAHVHTEPVAPRTRDQSPWTCRARSRARSCSTSRCHCCAWATAPATSALECTTASHWWRCRHASAARRRSPASERSLLVSPTSMTSAS